MKREIEEVVGLDCSNAILASAKQASVGCTGAVQGAPCPPQVVGSMLPVRFHLAAAPMLRLVA